MRYLGLDVGDERIGVSLSDETGTLARPLSTLERRSGPSSYYLLKDTIDRHGVQVVVVGLPLLEDGSEGKQVRSTRAYVAGLQTHVVTTIKYWDERYTTARAKDILASSTKRASHRDKRRSVDSIAAAVILQEYLDQRSGSASEAHPARQDELNRATASDPE